MWWYTFNPSTRKAEAGPGARGRGQGAGGPGGEREEKDGGHWHKQTGLLVCTSLVSSDPTAVSLSSACTEDEGCKDEGTHDRETRASHGVLGRNLERTQSCPVTHL